MSNSNWYSGTLDWRGSQGEPNAPTDEDIRRHNPGAEGTDTPKAPTRVTRFEVIDHGTGGEGRVLVKYGVSIELSYQDDGRTLKVFVRDRQ